MNGYSSGISVIVCCHNSSHRIRPTLEHIFAQRISDSLKWEVIVVDNNCTDDTVSIAQEIHQKYGNDIPFQTISEKSPGLSHARNAGFNAAQFGIALMVDDDNWLAPDYLAGISKVFTENGDVGMVGGKGIPKLRVPPPAWFTRYAYCYATGSQRTDDLSGPTEELYGAGLALRLDVLRKLRSHGFTSILSDRVGNILMSGGDTELCMAFRMAGTTLHYERSITFQHELPEGRVSWSYLKRLFHGFGMSKARLDVYTSMMGGKPIPKDGRLPFWLNRIIYLVKMFLPDLALLFRSQFRSMEGDDRLLRAMAKAGQIQGIWQIRHEYVSLYRNVAELKNRLEA